MTVSCPPLSRGDSIAEAGEWKAFVQELKRQWKLLWRERISDRLKAEGIASKDFELLFLDRGTVIIATRSYMPLSFQNVLDQYETPYEVRAKQETPSPQAGGWRKFGKKIAAMHSESRKRPLGPWSKNSQKDCKTRNMQLKKGGRGWLHIKAR